MHLLHISASPRKEHSITLAMAESFLATWKARHPDASVETMNVWEMDLLPFDGPALEAKYAGIAGVERTPEQVAVWQQIEALGERFHEADVLLFSVPMWNFGVPYRLKHLIDVVSQKDVLFTFDDRGLLGKLTGRRMVVLAARGASLGGHAAFDHQVSYLDTWAKMVGINVIESVVLERTLGGVEQNRTERERACAEAARLAKGL
jgi:FMN-dependent NADH-azoreductase